MLSSPLAAAAAQPCTSAHHCTSADSLPPWTCAPLHLCIPAGLRAPHELCARTLYEARWRAWLSAWEAGGRGGGGARGSRGGGGGGGRRNRTLFGSRVALRAVLGAAGASSAGEAEHARGQPDSATALSEACAEHERGCVPLRRASISNPPTQTPTTNLPQVTLVPHPHPDSRPNPSPRLWAQP